MACKCLPVGIAPPSRDETIGAGPRRSRPQAGPDRPAGAGRHVDRLFEQLPWNAGVPTSRPLLYVEADPSVAGQRSRPEANATSRAVDRGVRARRRPRARHRLEPPRARPGRGNDGRLGRGLWRRRRRAAEAEAAAGAGGLASKMVFTESATEAAPASS